MKESDKIMRVFIASAVAIVAVGVLYLVLTTMSLIEIGNIVK